MEISNKNYITPEKEKIRLEDVYKPPRNIQEEIIDVYEKYLRWRSLRESSYKQLNGIDLTDWLQEGREKFWGYKPLNEDADTPQFFFPETRNQIMAILSTITSLRLKPRFKGVEGFNIVKSTILKSLFECWRRTSNEKIKNFQHYLYMVENGTAVVFVGYKNHKKTVKNIKYHDPETGETEFEESEVDDSDIVEELCNLEDIYIPKPWESDIQEQEQIIWRTLLKFKDFKTFFSKYRDADKVFPGMQFADSSIFAQFMSYDIRGGDFVEVIRYFDCEKDKYMIIANGVLLNPVNVKGDKQEISPMPWNHKKLPFAKAVFEPIGSNFFYGMSLPQKVKDSQEALNVMVRLALEREIRAQSAPILTNDPTIEAGLEMKPGRIYQVGTDPNNYKELQMMPTSGGFYNLMNSMQGLMARTSTGGMGIPMSGKQPRSATEKAQEDEMKKQTASLQSLFYQDLLEQIAWLTIQNMIQFYTAEKTKDALGKGTYHKILSLSEIQLTGGGMGNREVRITDHPKSNDELLKESWDRSLLTKEKVEIIEVSPKALQKLRYDIEIDFESEQTPAEEKALYLDYVTTMYKLFGPSVSAQLGLPALIDLKKMMFRTAEKFDENIADIIPDQLIGDYQQEMFGFTDQPPQPQQQPQQPQQPQGQQQQGQPNAESLPAVNAINQRTRGRMMGGQGGIQNTA